MRTASALGSGTGVNGTGYEHTESIAEQALVAMKTASVGEHYVPSSNIRSAADIERAAAGVIDIDAKTTTYVVLACIVAASGGVLFGYDGGITGVVCLTSVCRSDEITLR